MEKIDFIITWVDGNDKAWQKEKNKYSGNPNGNGVNRYRDWGTLKYWFRGVEKFAPWVHKIHFVTWGHIPDWLDTNHPKINIVKHEDFIPKENLPLFNIRAMELHFHKIKGLAEQFVFFNDDFFLTKPVKETDFFKDGKPKDCFIENALMTNGCNDTYANSLLNDMTIVNNIFNKREVMKKNFFKIFNYRNGLKNLRTFLLLPWPYFSELYNPHTADALLKSTLKEVWQKEPNWLTDASKNRFRDYNDISKYVFRYYQLMSGNFSPRNVNFSHYFELTNKNDTILKAIKKQKYHIICMNDSTPEIEFEKVQKEILAAFESVLPEKSSFEK